MLIYCCSRYQKARNFALPHKNRIWRQFVFLDECLNCGKPIAEIIELKKNGETICAHRWTGNKAIEKLDKYISDSIVIQNSLRTGAKSNLDWHYINGSNQVYNLNDTAIFKFDTHINKYIV